jgi:hypothetical protein
MAENAEAIRALGWPPMQTDFGFTERDTVVMMQGVRSTSFPIYSAGVEAEHHAATIAESLSLASANIPYMVKTGQSSVALAINPDVARVFAESGWSKDALRRWLQDHVTTTVADMERWGPQSGTFDEDWRASAHEQFERLGRPFDEDRVPMITDPDRITIVVCGNPNRNQSRGYITNHRMGMQVARRADTRDQG